MVTGFQSQIRPRDKLNSITFGFGLGFSLRLGSRCGLQVARCSIFTLARRDYDAKALDIHLHSAISIFLQFVRAIQADEKGSLLLGKAYHQEGETEFVCK